MYLAALLLFLGGAGYLIVSGISSSSSYWVAVAKILDVPEGEAHTARVFGNVRADGLKMMDQSAGVRFRLEDKDDTQKTIWVTYTGLVPDTFEPGAEVIVDGTYHGSGRDFDAKSLITKCPSKYEKKNRTS